MSVSATFDNFRIDATREFAHTMIVVDDEAWKKVSSNTAPRGGLRPPKRSGAQATIQATQQELFQIRHALDTDALVTAAMDLGLVCSVIRPPKGKSIKAQVGVAARRADIICLDWEIHNDGGDAATKMIAEIVRSDEQRNGRLRLIAIYTGDTSNNEILRKVLEALPESYRARYKVERDPICIQSNHGLRIVCLFKAHGVQLADARKDRQVREAELPERLQKEFSRLAGGVLSNVALATIASIRDSTHHILAKMTAEMDGPYFHHRSVVPAAPDAEEYGVDIVLSDLKSAVDKTDVAQRYAGPAAIRARIREIAGDSLTLKLNFEVDGSQKEFDISVVDAIRLIVDGNKAAHSSITGNKPSANVFKRDTSSLFVGSSTEARSAMLRFALVTGVRAHPGSNLYKSGKKLPQLGLGSVILSPDKTYYLCLQASCDSVRLTKQAGFLFVPLHPCDEKQKPEVVVPVLRKGGVVECVGFSIPGTSYAESRSIRFEPDRKSQTVVASKLTSRRGFFFSATDGAAYKWVADLKQRRALRTAQKLGQSIGRLGFDEFEPFRQGGD